MTTEATARTDDRVPPSLPSQEASVQFRATPPPRRAPEYLTDAVRTANHQGIEQRASVGPMPSSPSIHFPILEMIRYANDYLRNSPIECQRERVHECHRLEMILIMTGNFSGYRFLESRVTDMTRREYTIPPRLLHSAGNTNW